MQRALGRCRVAVGDHDARHTPGQKRPRSTDDRVGRYEIRRDPRCRNTARRGRDRQRELSTEAHGQHPVGLQGREPSAERSLVSASGPQYVSACGSGRTVSATQAVERTPRFDHPATRADRLDMAAQSAFGGHCHLDVVTRLTETPQRVDVD